MKGEKKNQNITENVDGKTKHRKAVMSAYHKDLLFTYSRCVHQI